MSRFVVKQNLSTDYKQVKMSEQLTIKLTIAMSDTYSDPI